MIEWCAEIGSNHKGILSLAEEMVYQAKLAGATIAKFQLGRDPNDPIRYMDHWAHEIVDFCDMMDIEFMASVWSEDGLKVAQDVGMKRYKVAHQQARVSSDAFSPSIGPMSEHFECFYVSLGGRESMRWWGLLYPREPRNSKILPLWVSEHYPAEAVDIAGMPHVFRAATPISVQTGDGHIRWHGYSHHGRGIGAPLLAVARGAKYIECHFTLDKTEESIKDNHFALSPAEFKQMVKAGTEIARYV